jgi:hypothetical protein
MFRPTPAVRHWPLTSVLLFIVALLVTPTATAQQSNQVCEHAVFDTLAPALGLEDWDLSSSNDRIMSAACKRWPQQPQWTLATVAYDMGKRDEKELAVAVIDLQDRKIVSLHTETLSEDALTEVGPSSVHIDTARYLLNDQTAAFGVLFTSEARGASCPDATWADELMLFVPEGPKLRAVFSIHLRHLRGLQGSLCQGIDTHVWETASLTVQVAKHTSHGWRDLLVKARIHVDTDGGTPVPQKDRTETHTFRYDGHRYRACPRHPWWADSLGH